MAIERATTLYPRNGTVVDTGTGIEVRLLSATQTGTNEVNQSVQYTHTQDSTNRTFIPNSLGSTSVRDARSLQKCGWGLRLTEDTTPTDDTNCNAYVYPTSAVITAEMTANQSGGTYVLGTWTPTMFVGLFSYNPATDTGTLIANAASDQAGGIEQTWTVGTGADLGTYKTVQATIPLPSGGQIAQGEILLLQIGTNAKTIPDPTVGTATWTLTLRINNATSKMVFGGVRQSCAFTLNTVGDALLSDNMAAGLSRSATGDGVGDFTRAATVSKTFDLAGDGVTSMARALDISRDATGDGISSMTRTVVAAKSFTVLGDGVVDRMLAASMSRSATGDGVASSSKATIASKTFSLSGDGTITEVHPVQAYRTFSLVGDGFIPTNGVNGSSITVPLDELPDGTGSTIINKTDIYVFDD